MSKKNSLLTIVSPLLVAFGGLALSSCNQLKVSPSDVEAFHNSYLQTSKTGPLSTDLQLYVDNSSCIAEGQQSPFYQSLVPVLTNRCKAYFSIRGPKIVEEDLTEQNAYTRLKSIKDMSYAAIKEAAERIVQGNQEAVLLTDCEYYEKTLAGSNVNNPYLKTAFSTWLERGHDIYIIAEPYVEINRGKSFSKKRYYIIFTNRDLENNVYQELTNNVSLSAPGISLLHLSATVPSLSFSNGKHSTPDENLAADVKQLERAEVQNWNASWKTIQALYMADIDMEGNSNPLGHPVITGLSLKQEAGDLLRVDDVQMRVVPLNEKLASYIMADSTASILAPTASEIEALRPVPNFMLIDKDAWNANREIKLYMDRKMFDPTILDNSAGTHNFFRIDLLSGSVYNAINSDYALQAVLSFDDIAAGTGGLNYSLLESVKICLNEPSIQNRLKDKVLYSIYVASPKY